MRPLLFAALLALAGCQTDGYSSLDHQFAEQNCPATQQYGKPNDYPDRNACLAHNLYISRTLGNVAAARSSQGQSYYGGAYYPAPVPASDAPPLPNIIPPTVRCQSVSAGLGTVQTICR